MLNKVNLEQAFAGFEDHWNPRIAAELNGQHVKIAKLLGEFDWHHHENEDELFLVRKGSLELQWKQDGQTNSTHLNEGEMFVVPRGVEHRPVAKLEAEVVLFEPATTLNTGNVTTERTRRELDRI